MFTLVILLEGPSYGYAILKRVRELSGGDLEWTDGMLYPLLHRLERSGRVSSPNGATPKPRDVASTTESPRRGRAQLAEQRRQWTTANRTLGGLWVQAAGA